jgi:hypothetical protein
MSFYIRSHDEEQRDVVISPLSDKMATLLLVARYENVKTTVAFAIVKS